MIAATTALSFAVLCFCMRTGESYTYMMGHFPAPWGNEIRAGVLEGLTASMFGIVMFLSVLGGVNHTASDVEGSKLNLFYIMIDLMLSSLLALVYTNDLFTAYVFVEINTIAGCGLIMIRQKRKSMSAAIRYMIMSQLGSGLFLIGLSMLYDVTGHLLMSPARESAALILDSGSYTIPMLVILAVISVGLAIKSGLYPFHYWIPDTYGYATPTASAVLSGLVSKGYIFLLIKIFYRVLGENFVIGSHLINVLYCFGVAGMVMGSVHAIAEKDTRRMIAYSSVAQIGYIYMGIGMGTGMGMVAAVLRTPLRKRSCLSAPWGFMRCRGTGRITTACAGPPTGIPWRGSALPWAPSPWWAFPCFPALSQSFYLPRQRFTARVRCCLP